MTEPGSLRRRLRRILAPLVATPLHPQWAVARQHRGRTAWVAARARGDVLDVGCAGAAIRTALAHCDRYCGLDYPTTASGLYGTRPELYGDARKLPFADASFDTVLLLDVLEHIAEPEAALAEARRVLRADGGLLVTIPFAYPMHDQPHDYQRLTEHGLRDRLRRAGFREVAIDEAGSAAEAAAASLCMALAQGGIDALAARGWRRLWLPLLPPLVLLANLVGWLAQRVLPTRHLMPGGYYVQARDA